MATLAKKTAATLHQMGKAHLLESLIGGHGNRVAHIQAALILAHRDTHTPLLEIGKLPRIKPAAFPAKHQIATRDIGYLVKTTSAFTGK